jgi:transposase
MLDKKLSEMRSFFFPMFPFSLPGLEIQHIERKETCVTITAHTTSPTAICPVCQHVSHRLHS